MEKLYLPKGYSSQLDVWETEHAIKFIKDTFQTALASSLKLRRITAPIVVESGTGLNDNLNGESPVTFNVGTLNKGKAEIVQSLAKWKRYALWRHQIEEEMGIYTDMNALRPHEEVTNIHSVYVDQWDWEKVMHPQERNIEYLYETVSKIYEAIKSTQFLVSERFPKLRPFLPKQIKFITAEELRVMYPDKTAKEREYEIAKEHGAVFIRGIGGILGDGMAHDDRSPDYDDWSTKMEDGSEGLNGDIIIWNPILKNSFEISSMGIRVDSSALLEQLKIRGAEDRKELYFHSLLLNEKLPQTIGGGIGQSRLCMLLLQKLHIGEVQAGLWPSNVQNACKEAGVFLL